MASSTFVKWNNYDCPLVPSPFFLSSATDDTDCRNKCDRDSNCQAYVWDESNKTCHLKASKCVNEGSDTSGKTTWQKLPALNGYFSIPNTDCPSSYDLAPAINNTGYTFDQFMKTCKDKCDTNPNCKAIITDGNKCWLKGADCLSSEKKQTNVDTIRKSAYTQAFGYMNLKNMTCDSMPTLRNVTTSGLDDCRTRCDTDPNCSTFSVNSTGNNCVLKQGAYGGYTCKTTATTKPGWDTYIKLPLVNNFLPKEARDCPDSNNLATYTNLNIPDCAKACTDNPNCKSFVTDGGGSCWLKGAECPYMLKPVNDRSTYVLSSAISSNYIKKPGQICEGNPLVPPLGMTITPNMFPLSVASPADCKSRCDKNPDCGAYQTDGATKCWLRGGQYCVNSIASNLNYDTYVKMPSLTGYSSSSNKDCPGVADLETHNDITISECKRRCDIHPLCKSMIYDGAKLCKLKGFDCRLPNVVDKQNLALYTQTSQSANAYIRKAEWNCPNIGSEIQTLATVANTTPRECRILCDKDKDCQAFVSVNEKDCVLKKISNTTKDCLKNGFRSVTTDTFQKAESPVYQFSVLENKRCPNASDVTKEMLSGVKNVPKSPSECSMLCLTASKDKPAESQCGAVEWNAATGICTYRGLDCPLNLEDFPDDPWVVYQAPDVRVEEEVKPEAAISSTVLLTAGGAGLLIIILLVICVIFVMRRK